MRRALLAWEFWIPPILAIVAIASFVWLMSHNQDLMRQSQIDRATQVHAEQVTERVTTQIQSLAGEVRALRGEVKTNTRDIKTNKASADAEPHRP